MGIIGPQWGAPRSTGGLTAPQALLVQVAEARPLVHEDAEGHQVDRTGRYLFELGVLGDHHGMAVTQSRTVSFSSFVVIP